MIIAGLLAAAAIGAGLAYRAMVDVKPRVVRPVLDEATRADVDALRASLMRHVSVLAGEIGERSLFRPESLRAAADYISGVWSSQGFSVSTEPFDVDGRPCANLLVERRGSTRPGEVVVVGAHYDTVAGSPGANDNATGVAVLLEMSRALRHVSLSRTVRFVAFVNEEPPFFQSEHMGSRRHARAARQRGDAIVAMISLETLGYYSEAPGSQQYPFPLGAFYPSAGNFLGVVGNLASRSLVRDVLAQFMAVTDFPVEGAATLSWLPGVDWSDHWSFWQEGYPAVMLTDTALYRYPDYHSATDRPAQITAPAFARAAHGIIGVVRRLAER